MLVSNDIREIARLVLDGLTNPRTLRVVLRKACATVLYDGTAFARKCLLMQTGEEKVTPKLSRKERSLVTAMRSFVPNGRAKWSSHWERPPNGGKMFSVGLECYRARDHGGKSRFMPSFG